MAERSYRITFATAAELSGATATAKALRDVGKATDEVEDKLTTLENEFKTRMEAVSASIEKTKDELKNNLAEGAEEGSEELAEELQERLATLAGRATLIGGAVALGRGVGQALGNAVVDAYEGTLGEKLEAALTLTWNAKAEAAAKEWQSQLRQKNLEINKTLIEDQRQFWKDYMDARPDDATDWIEEIEAKATKASRALSGLAKIQAAEGDYQRMQIERDAQDKQDSIDRDTSLTPDERRTASFAVEQDKENQLLMAREAARKNELDLMAAGQSLKQSEVENLARVLAVQQKRVEIENEANRILALELAARPELTESGRESWKRQAFAQASQNGGLQVEADTNQAGALMKAREEYFAALRDLQQVAAELQGKVRETNLKSLTDVETVFQDLQRKRDALNAANEVENQRPALPANPFAVPPPGPQNIQTPEGSTGDLQGLLGRGAQATGDPALKMALEDLKQRLSDGSSETELREAAQLMERAQADRSDAVRQIAAAIRQALASQNAALSALKTEVQALREITEQTQARVRG